MKEREPFGPEFLCVFAVLVFLASAAGVGIVMLCGRYLLMR